MLNYYAFLIHTFIILLKDNLRMNECEILVLSISPASLTLEDIKDPMYGWLCTHLCHISLTEILRSHTKNTS